MISAVRNTIINVPINVIVELLEIAHNAMLSCGNLETLGPRHLVFLDLSFSLYKIQSYVDKFSDKIDDGVMILFTFAIRSACSEITSANCNRASYLTPI